MEPARSSGGRLEDGGSMDEVMTVRIDPPSHQPLINLFIDLCIIDPPIVHMTRVVISAIIALGIASGPAAATTTGIQQQVAPPSFRGPKEYCYYETFDARCADNELIVMTTGLYGRMRFGRCAKTNFGFMGCYTDVLDLLDQRCSGRQSCSVEVVEPTFDSVRPCNQELKSYLEADYRCIRVVDYSSVDCDVNLERYERTLAVSPGTSEQRTLAVGSSTSNKCGTELFPWQLHIAPGQRVNISLVNFVSTGLTADDELGPPQLSPVGCSRLVARIVEPSVKRSVDVCATSSGQRESHTHVATTSPIELYLQHSQQQQQQQQQHDYLLVFTAVGCADYPATVNTWVRYSTDKQTAEVGCHVGSSISWQLLCRGNDWTGFVDNCSLLAVSQSSSTSHDDTGIVKLNSVVVALIVIGVSAVISLCVLIVGLIVFRRLRVGRLHNTRQQHNRIVLSCPVTSSDRDVNTRSYHLSPQLDLSNQATINASTLNTATLPTNNSSVTRLRCQVYHSFVNDCGSCCSPTNHFRSNGNSTISTTPPVDENATAARSENALNERRDDIGCDVSKSPMMASLCGVAVDCGECPECLAECALNSQLQRYDLVGPSLLSPNSRNSHHVL